MVLYGQVKPNNIHNLTGPTHEDGCRPPKSVGGPNRNAQNEERSKEEAFFVAVFGTKSLSFMDGRLQYNCSWMLLEFLAKQRNNDAWTSDSNWAPRFGLRGCRESFLHHRRTKERKAKAKADRQIDRPLRRRPCSYLETNSIRWLLSESRSKKGTTEKRQTRRMQDVSGLINDLDTSLWTLDRLLGTALSIVKITYLTRRIAVDGFKLWDCNGLLTEGAIQELMGGYEIGQCLWILRIWRDEKRIRVHRMISELVLQVFLNH